MPGAYREMKKMNFGYVYFITYDSEEWRKVLPFVKIGFTNNLSRRMMALSTGSPVSLLLAGYIETEFPQATEEKIHGDLAVWGARVNGEWFKVNKRSMYIFESYDIKENKIAQLFPIGEEHTGDDSYYRTIIKSQSDDINELERINEMMRNRLIEIDPLAHKYITRKSVRPNRLGNSRRVNPR
jgi:hypothetical protein